MFSDLKSVYLLEGLLNIYTPLSITEGLKPLLSARYFKYLNSSLKGTYFEGANYKSVKYLDFPVGLGMLESMSGVKDRNKYLYKDRF